MAEAVAVIGFLAAIGQLATYGARIVTRLNEFRNNVKDLPSSFLHISVQLPLLIDIVHRLHGQASRGELAPQTEKLLLPVVEGLQKEIYSLDGVLRRVLPSADASTWEKSIKAVKSVGAQKSVDDFAAVIRDYVANLTAFQTTHNSDLIRRTIKLLEEQHLDPNPPSYTATTPMEVKPMRTPIWMLKYDSDADFVGRDGTIGAIDGQIEERNHRVALSGIGGVGKSRIAIQYCYRYREKHSQTNVLWVFGASKARFEADYQRIARFLDIPDRDDREKDILRPVCDWLSDENNGPWMMVVDSADDSELWLGSTRRKASPENSSMPLIDYLPRGTHGRILVTTRDSQLGKKLLEGKQDPIQVTRFEPKEARILLSAKLSEERDLSHTDVDELTSALEYLPLTITQAAAYLKEIEITASEYLELFRAGESDIPNLLVESMDDPGRDRETPNSVFQTWRISFDHILKQSPSAADMLSLMAVLDRQAISQDLLQRPGDGELEFRAAISKLRAFSLITEERASSKYGLHRLVQLSTQKWLEHHGTISTWEEAAVSAVARQYPPVVEYKVWPLIQDLNSHSQVVLQYGSFNKSHHIDRAKILNGLGHYHSQQGQLPLALQLLTESRRLREEHLGPEHEDTLTTLGYEGSVYSKKGDFERAQQLQKDLIQKSMRVLGPNHLLTLKSMSRLAQTYNKGTYNKGIKHGEAKELQLQVLALMEQILGPENQDTLVEMNNLAFTCNKLKHWRQAEDIGLKVLTIRTRVLGAKHPDTLTIMANLAWTYGGLSRWDEAEELERKVLEYRTEVLGPGHSKTLLAMSNLAETYSKRGRLDKAETLQRQALEERRRVLGEKNDDTLNAERRLARLEKAKGKAGGGVGRMPSQVEVLQAGETRPGASSPAETHHATFKRRPRRGAPRSRGSDGGYYGPGLQRGTHHPRSSGGEYYGPGPQRGAHRSRGSDGGPYGPGPRGDTQRSRGRDNGHRGERGGGSSFRNERNMDWRFSADWRQNLPSNAVSPSDSPRPNDTLPLNDTTSPSNAPPPSNATTPGVAPESGPDSI